MISRCNSPRKPQRKPKPNAAEVSISNEKLASFNRSLPIAARRLSKSLASTGNRPQNTTGIAGLLHLGGEETDTLDVIGGVGAHHPDTLALFHRAIDNAHQHHDAEIDVVPAVDQKRLQRGVRVALRRRQP